MDFTYAVSREIDPQAAGADLVRSVQKHFDGQVDLACLFFSPHYIPHAESLAATVREECAPSVLMGCSGEGIIAGGQEIERTPAVALWVARLPGAVLSPLRISVDDDRVLIDEERGLDIVESAPSTVLLLADPFSTPMDDVLTWLGEQCPGALAIGGMAGGGQDVAENRLVLDAEIHDSGMVGVAVSGAVAIRTVVSQGCRPIGERYVVTKSERNLIYELSGSPALERLQSMFESLNSHDKNLAQQALHVGIVMDEQRNRFERGDFLVRNLIGADRTSGSVAIGDAIKEGQTVQFHVRDAHSATEDLHVLLAADRARHPKPPLGALVFSCCGRGRALFGRPHHDASIILERVGDIPMAGFFAQGEIGPVGGTNFLHGYTASVALFAEPDLEHTQPSR